MVGIGPERALGDVDADVDERLYYTMDANWNVTAVVDGLATSATFGQVVVCINSPPRG